VGSAMAEASHEQTFATGEGFILPTRRDDTIQLINPKNPYPVAVFRDTIRRSVSDELSRSEHLESPVEARGFRAGSDVYVDLGSVDSCGILHNGRCVSWFH